VLVYPRECFHIGTRLEHSTGKVSHAASSTVKLQLKVTVVEGVCLPFLVPSICVS
jgi:hypothetical protein